MIPFSSLILALIHLGGATEEAVDRRLHEQMSLATAARSLDFDHHAWPQPTLPLTLTPPFPSSCCLIGRVRGGRARAMHGVGQREVVDGGEGGEETLASHASRKVGCCLIGEEEVEGFVDRHGWSM